MAASNTHLNHHCFEALDPCERESYYESMYCGCSSVPLSSLSCAVLCCAQQAAQLGPRCGSHVMRSWEAEDKRPMVGLLIGLGSVPQRFKLDVAVGAI